MQTPTQIIVQPGPTDPGLFDLTVTNSVSGVTIDNGAKLWPNLAASTSGIGQPRHHPRHRRGQLAGGGGHRGVGPQRFIGLSRGLHHERQVHARVGVAGCAVHENSVRFAVM